MTEAWQTPAATAAEEARKVRRDAWAAQVRAERVAREAERAVEQAEMAEASSKASIDLSAAPSHRTGKSLDEVGWNWDAWDEQGCENTLLGWIYRQRHHEGNRRAESSLEDIAKTGNRTGIPDSEAKLAPRGARKSGIETVLESTISPIRLAARCILRDTDAASSADGTAGADLWNLKEDMHVWREDEELIHGELAYRFKKLFIAWNKKGWLLLEPTMKWSAGDSSGLGRDGMPAECRLTYAAIEAAETRIKGTRLAKGPGNPLGTKTQKQRDEIRNKASWFYKEWAQGAKAGT